MARIHKSHKLKSLDFSPYDVIKTPIVTEKTTNLSGLVFKVNKVCNKVDIKNAIEFVFNVKVQKIRIANYKGKPKRSLRNTGTSVSYKKAMVTLKDGYKIDLIEGI